MGISTEDIKKLREETGVSVMQCKAALEEAGGDREQALKALRAAGAHIVAKKSDRELGAGVVRAYIHGGGTVGAMVELFCETDFVAKNEEFKALAYEIALQVAATDDEVIAGGGEELLKQPYIKSPERTVGDLIQDAVQKFGERTELGRIAKFAI